jgi:hypothetical protein
MAAFGIVIVEYCGAQEPAGSVPVTHHREQTGSRLVTARVLSNQFRGVLNLVRHV